MASQVYASAPDQSILLNTATSFLQGLYPPLLDLKPEIASQTVLNNGSTSTSPLEGYQYVVLHGEKANSPDAIWIKGDDNCPAVIEASESFEASEEYLNTFDSTRDFYRSLFPAVQGVFDYRSPDNMSYAKAFDIFDLVNVARIHNATSPARNVTDEQLFQLRTLANSAEFGYNFNTSQPARSLHAETLAGAVLAQLNQTVASKGKLKFSLLAGSYDVFLAFFGLANLTSASPDFFGLPDYASTMAFEVFTTANSTEFPADAAANLRVRFLFRNSTYGQPTAFPLFGKGEDSLSWPDFVKEIRNRAITSASQWCSLCRSSVSFCAAYKSDTDAGGSEASGNGRMSNAVAGVIGAMVTLAVVALVSGLAFVLLRKRQSGEAQEKTSVRSGSGEGRPSSV